VSVWSDAAGAALLAGVTELRVATDTTPWTELATPRPMLMRREHFGDRDRPFDELCVGDASVLDDQARAETVCIRPSGEGLN
jgi:hypothetical protein